MGSFGQLDKFTIKRIENILKEEDIVTLKKTINSITVDLINDGYEFEDIHDYVVGILVDEFNKLEEQFIKKRFRILKKNKGYDKNTKTKNNH